MNARPLAVLALLGACAGRAPGGGEVPPVDAGFVDAGVAADAGEADAGTPPPPLDAGCIASFSVDEWPDAGSDAGLCEGTDDERFTRLFLAFKERWRPDAETLNTCEYDDECTSTPFNFGCGVLDPASMTFIGNCGFAIRHEHACELAVRIHEEWEIACRDPCMPRGVVSLASCPLDRTGCADGSCQRVYDFE